MSNPSQSLSSHKSSNYPRVCLVFGILKCTTSPIPARRAFDRRLFMSSKDVRPEGLTRHRVMRHAACRISQRTVGEDSRTGAESQCSSADLSVRICSSLSWMALSMVPLVLESPTCELSNAVPYSDARHFAISRAMSLADVS